MIEDEYLPYFITEDIYLVAGDHPQPTANPEEATVTEPKVAAEVKPEPVAPEIPKVAPKIHELAIWTPPLTAPDKELLVKILAAIKEDFSKAHLMQGINAYEPHYKKLLCFGYQKELELKLGSSASLYQPTEIYGRKVLVSVAPADLQINQKQKALLWEALQKMFLK